MSSLTRLLNFFVRKKADESTHENIKRLQSRLIFKIRDQKIYLKALTHRSYLEISPQFDKSNERLEFLGDSVLSLVISERLFSEFSDSDEGFLTKYRSQLVDKKALVEAASRIELESLILFDNKYVRGSEEGKKTILADCFEALIGAIYLDAGFQNARQFIEETIIIPALESGAYLIDRNYKGQLLEYIHANKLPQPVYKILSESGPDHEKIFTVGIFIGDKLYGRGTGKNKKNAEQLSAQTALKILKKG